MRPHSKPPAPTPDPGQDLHPAPAATAHCCAAVFAAAVSAVPAARVWTCLQLASHGHGGAAPLVGLLVGELAANAAIHAATAQFTIRLCLNVDRIQVAVHDDDPATTPRISPAGDLDEHGRGLTLVDALSHDWGINVTTGEKSVWFHLHDQATNP